MFTVIVSADNVSVAGLNCGISFKRFFFLIGCICSGTQSNNKGIAFLLGFMLLHLCQKSTNI